MKSPIRIGIIGVGFGHHVHVPAFRADARCQVVAICARTPEHARQVADQLEVPRAYGDAGEMLNSGCVDAASIAVPPAKQSELVVLAANAGKHVFCEKPLAADLAAASRAHEAVERAGVVHAMDFLFPEIDAWQQARSALESGAIGKLRHVALSWRVETYAFANHLDSWKVRSMDGGGTLNSFVSHSFYYMEWLLGPIARLAARLTPRGNGGDARVDAWLEMASGCPVSMSVAADAFLGSGHRLEIYGEQGTLFLENHSADYVNGFTLSTATRESRALSVRQTAQFPQRDGRIGAAGAIAKRFVDAILSGTPVRPNLGDGVRVQKLIETAREADLTGAWKSA